MTIQEAIELVKQCGLNIEGIANIECESLVVSALEKQIPKKPKILTYKPLIDSGWKYGCPNCECAVGVNKHIKFAYEEYLEPYENCCPTCGQALDWSDAE